MIGYLHTNDVSASFHKSLLNLIVFDRGGPKRVGQVADVKCGALAIPYGRNDLCRALLRGRCEWLLMVDGDMGFEPFALDQLLSLADPERRPMVGGLCFANRESISDGMNGMRCFPKPTLFDWIDGDPGGRYQGRAHYPVNTLLRTAATGSAFVLIHRSVVERVNAEYGENWFSRLPNSVGGLQGEDISFCSRTRSLGIPLYVHTGIRTTHLKWRWLGEQDFWSSFLAPPARERCDVVVPVLHRPGNVERFMVSLKASTGLATAWFVCEPDDHEEMAEVGRWGGEVLVWDGASHPGRFAEKVNFACRRTEAPWLLLVGDDVSFRAGWLDQAQDVAGRYGSNVVGTNDLCNPRVMRGEHATHPMIRRSYIEEVGASFDGPGVVCHEGYRHWFVDDEIVVAAKRRRTFQMALAAQVEHLHPIGGTAEMDEVYSLGNESVARDRELCERRVRAGSAG